MTRSTFHYGTYIRTTSEKLWSALTTDARSAVKLSITHTIDHLQPEVADRDRLHGPE